MFGTVIAYASSVGLDEAVHMHSITRASTAHTHKDKVVGNGSGHKLNLWPLSPLGETLKNKFRCTLLGT